MREDETYEDSLWPETEIRRIWYEPSGEQEQGFEFCRLWNIEIGGWLAAFVAWLVFC